MFGRVVNTKVTVYKTDMGNLVKKILKISLKSRNIAYLNKIYWGEPL